MGKSFVYNTGSSNDDIANNHLELTFGLFFDGTLNNLENTKLRKKYRDEDFLNNDKKDDYSFDKEGEKARKKARNNEYQNYIDSDTNNFTAEKKKYLEASHKTFFDSLGVDNSFSNDYTNVARMSMCCTIDYTIYIEGIGTDNNVRDVDQGFQYGSGNTGIRAKVRKACELLADKIKIKIDDKKNKNKIVTQVTVDVFGFSRGAAAARNFVYEITEKPPFVLKKTGEFDRNTISKDLQNKLNHQKQQSIPKTVKRVFDNYGGLPSIPAGGIKAISLTPSNIEPIYGEGDSDGKPVDASLIKNGKMPEMGHLGYSLLKLGLAPEILKELRIIVRLVGLYDTVSSYEEDGDGKLKEEDEGTIIKGIEHLRNSKFKDDVEQLHLNNLNAAQKIVHFTAKDEHRENFDLTRVPLSDRVVEKNLPGVHCDIGGAYENGKEIVDEIETGSMIYALGKLLIENYWYKKDQLTYMEGFYSKLVGERMIKKEYSYLPLHFMEVFFKELTQEKFMSRSTVIDYPINSDGTLEDTKKHLEKYVFDKGGVEWEFINDEKLKILSDNVKFDKLLKEGKLKEEKELKYDNLNPKDYRSKNRIELDNIPGLAKEPKEDLKDYDDQTLLRILRNGYFHWSASRDWFGMDQAGNSIRDEHPTKKTN
ncbi:hypothetical protein HNQ02_003801 [Flavobacterium sp. 7E]|uniref:phospholipase effector Tle1 domain-containing protein n=1 Tax=Flavobacterium sp. 7E TaxID=2735898 RepID=UPI001570EFD7|nr:DUF2235 domain-containing protein [Flavobacterium sp. 7E]NRS90854.1 hypothetical protein [Flavobacterium sp. 7E]